MKTPDKFASMPQHVDIPDSGFKSPSRRPRSGTRIAVLSFFAIILICADADGQKSVVLNPHGDTSISVDCAACHTANAFRPARRDMDFDHNRQTGFPLLGRHSEVACASCHLDLKFDEPEIQPAECGSCHVDVHQGSLSAACSSCHNTASFQDVNGLSVHAATSFPLTGAHEQIACQSCHVDDSGGAFASLDASCESCHASDYAAAAIVDHVSLGFPTTCEQCHSTMTWRSGELFDHTSASGGFDLVGAHEVAACSSCHASPGLALLFDAASQDDCYSCHAPDYVSEHQGSGFPTTCTTCHGTDNWDSNGSFDHSIASDGFELIGAHASTSCSSCHAPQTFEPLFAATSDDDCYSCHAPNYESEHQGSGFPTTCTTCHGTDSWDASGSFDHNTASGGFDLVGAHAVAACESCHAPQTFEPLFAATGDDDCYSCHAPDYESAHQGSGFPTTCATCHGTDSWDSFSGSFDHSTASGGFDLVGAHSVAACESCHATPGFEPLFTATSDDDCYSCHAPDYESEHQGSGFPTTCATCHGTDSWDASGSFDHSTASGGFDLVGAHSIAACESCHATPGFEPLFTATGDDDCYSCHLPDYESEHQGSGFPTTCATCHGTDTWNGASFANHDADYFPIYSGAHRGEWNTCETCHTNPADFQVFTCLVCHEHSQSRMDDKHSERNGYVYESVACLNCHPRGRH